jgi:hypothetical protein
MKLCFKGDTNGLEQGIHILKELLGFECSPHGLPVEIRKEYGNIKVDVKGGMGVLGYDRKIHFFRALGLLIEELQNADEFVIFQNLQFDMNGVMFDCSRNAVLKVESIKKILRTMALMGLDTFMLYTEDTYTIEDEPYFGYMRGRYTFEELKECDDYADIFGIEIIPCIQTLSHLEQFLKWKVAEVYKDSNDTLLVGGEKIYTLIEKMIVSASAPFRSRRIHIGMDEAEGMGRGRYIDLYGNCDRYKAFMEHLDKVLEIVKRYGLRPMMWSDMFIKLGSSRSDYYDLDSVIPAEVIEKLPGDLDLVAWDYYHGEQKYCEAFLRKHRSFKCNTIFAGGILTFTGGFCTNYGATFANSNAALAACKEEGIREVFTTLWLDDGGENNIFTALLGLQLYAEHGYAGEVDMEKLKKRVKLCTGIDYDAYRSLQYIDETPGAVPDNLDFANPSKFLMFQDILMGLFDKHIEGLELSSHYAGLKERFGEYSERGSQYSYIFSLPEKLCAVLEIKCDLGIRIKQAYDQKDLTTLLQIAEKQLPKLKCRVEELRNAHLEQWFEAYKPFGWEVFDIRYGGVLSRIDTVKRRLLDYLQGSINRIDELEEEKLYFDGLVRPSQEKGLGVFNCYKRIASANVI